MSRDLSYKVKDEPKFSFEDHSKRQEDISSIHANFHIDQARNRFLRTACSKKHVIHKNLSEYTKYFSTVWQI